MVTITDSVLTDNLSEGGCLVNDSGAVTIVNSTLADNHITGISNRGTVTIVNSTLARNEFNIFASGGAIENHGGTVTILSSTLADNQAPEGGGGLWNSGTVTLINSTVAGNRVGGFGTGGILNAGGTVRLQNILVARNVAPFSGIPDCAGAITSLGHNLLGDPTGCTFTPQGTDLTGDAVSGPLEPALGPFTDTGAPGEGYFPLLADSPAIDAGDAEACPKTDQLGEKRIGPCDIGAVEFQGEKVSGR
jgi:hypothetical protein